MSDEPFALFSEPRPENPYAGVTDLCSIASCPEYAARDVTVENGSAYSFCEDHAAEVEARVRRSLWGGRSCHGTGMVPPASPDNPETGDTT